MYYFLIADDQNTLRHLPDFQITFLEPKEKAIPTVDGIQYLSRSIRPAVFTCTQHPDMRNAGNFLVIDESGVIHQCSGSRVSPDNGNMVGVINDVLAPSNKEQAIRTVKNAIALLH